MEKIERFLDKYSGFLKLGIWILIIFWAAQGYVVFEKGWEQQKAETAMYENDDNVLMQKAEMEFRKFGNDLIEKARWNKNYSPVEYFEDLKKLKLKNKKLYHRELPILQYTTRVIHGYSMPEGTLFARKEAVAEIVPARDAYGEWLKTADVHLNSVDRLTIASDKNIEINWPAVLDSIWSWVVNLYAKSFFLIILFYFVRMSKDRWANKGILETVLADKKKFLLAIFFWPSFVSKYPFNVVREIRVEAELRRLGKTFRRFNLKERRLVRRIANSSDYKIWIANFRSENELSFQRSFLFALTLTIAVNVFNPAVNSVEASLSRDGPQIAISHGIEDDSGSQDSHVSDLTSDECLAGMQFEIPKPEISRAELLRERFKEYRFAKRIDLIPIRRLFSSRILILN